MAESPVGLSVDVIALLALAGAVAVGELLAAAVIRPPAICCW